MAPPRALDARPAGWHGSRLVVLSRGLPKQGLDAVVVSAQGAASALEDAAVLSRCLAGGGLDDIPAACRRFEAARKEHETGKKRQRLGV